MLIASAGARQILFRRAVLGTSPFGESRADPASEVFARRFSPQTERENAISRFWGTARIFSRMENYTLIRLADGCWRWRVTTPPSLKARAAALAKDHSRLVAWNRFDERHTARPAAGLLRRDRFTEEEIDAPREGQTFCRCSTGGARLPTGPKVSFPHKGGGSRSAKTACVSLDAPR